MIIPVARNIDHVILRANSGSDGFMSGVITPLCSLNYGLADGVNLESIVK